MNQNVIFQSETTIIKKHFLIEIINFLFVNLLILFREFGNTWEDIDGLLSEATKAVSSAYVATRV